MPKPTIQARVDERMHREVKAIADERGLSKSEATRLIAERGLQKMKEDETMPTQAGGLLFELVSTTTSVLAAFTIALSAATLVGYLPYWSGIALSAATAVTAVAGVLLLYFGQVETAQEYLNNHLQTKSDAESAEVEI